MRTFYFNTGVRPGIPENERHNPNALPVGLTEGQVWRNGTKQIPFDCDVPDNAVFKMVGNNPDGYGYGCDIVAEIHNSTIRTKYAYFTLKQ